jgi:hypothetical protein
MFRKLNIGCSSGSVSFSISTRDGGICMMLTGLDDDGLSLVGGRGGADGVRGASVCTSGTVLNVLCRNLPPVLPKCFLSGESVEDLEERRFEKEEDHAENATKHGQSASASAYRYFLFPHAYF